MMWARQGRSSLEIGAVRFVSPWICVFVSVMVGDGCLHRDPYFLLRDGYSVGGIAPSEPCSLDYSRATDPRLYSDWEFRETDVSDKNGRRRLFQLFNARTGEELEFDSSERLAAAAVKNRAGPRVSWTVVDDVTAFALDGEYVYGKSRGGYFLLSIAANRSKDIGDEAGWRTAVQAACGHPPQSLIDVRNRWRYTREAGFIWFVAAAILAAGISNVVTALRGRRRRVVATGSCS